jgi:NADH-quinone oxidoreductase subunit M
VRWVANGFGLLGFLVSLPLWFRFDRGSADFQFVERVAWIPSIGVQYLLGVDGISTLLILLTTLLGAIAILSSWNAVTERVRAYYVVPAAAPDRDDRASSARSTSSCSTCSGR